MSCFLILFSLSLKSLFELVIISAMATYFLHLLWSALTLNHFRGIGSPEKSLEVAGVEPETSLS